MIHISTFTGEGGFDLAAEDVGWENMASCEINEFCNKILAYYWPQAYHHRNIRTFTYKILNDELTERYGPSWRNRKVILTGGFPCQPFSVAGQRKGKEDDRYLWPEGFRFIDELRPDWICLENVTGIISMVQPEATEVTVESQASLFEESYESITTEQREYVIETICSDLERIGYSVQPIIIPACATGAPHRRDRVWFIAHSCSNGHELRGFKEDRCQASQSEGVRNQRERIWNDHWRVSKQGAATHTNSQRFTERICTRPRSVREQKGAFEGRQPSRTYTAGDWAEFPTQSPICDGDDGISARLDGITFSKWRSESIKAGGNAIVRQVARQIFQAIQQFETHQPCNR